VTLFAFGRTLSCACGARVGAEPQRGAARAGGEPRFAADAMLGRLAHWLRLLGLDTWYEAHVADGALVRRALEEGRTLLTRDRALPHEWRLADVYLVQADDPRAQLREVAARFDLGRRARPFSRCSRCNEPLREAPRAGLRGRVPPRVAASAGAISECPRCGRLYWEGSHVDRMRRVLEAVLA
jgi:hypothetical protein